jgi:hypothetical protein
VRGREHPLAAPLLQALAGAALGALFVLALCAFDLHGLGTLIAQDRAPGIALLLLLAGLGGTFAAGAFGTALCLMHPRGVNASRGTLHP